MKAARRVLVIALATLGLTAVVACGGGATPTPTPTQPPGQSSTPTPTPSFDAAAYFSGKTITIHVGFTAGGGYDTSARAWAQVAPKHFPGSPRFVINNIPGSGGELVFRAVDQAPADGLTAANIHPRFFKRELLGTDVPFLDLETFKMVGAPTAALVTQAYYVDRNRIGTSWEDILALGRPVTEGATAPGDTGSLGTTFVELLGGPIRLVYGYGGTSEIMAAFDRGELDGTNRGNYTQAPRLYPEWIEQRRIVPVLRWGAEPEDDPNFVDYVQNQLGDPIPPHVFEVVNAGEGERSVYRVTEAVNELLSRAFFVHPDTPDHIYQVWVDAFRATVEDPEFAELMAGLGLEAGYLSPEEGQSLLDEGRQTVQDPRLRELFEELSGGEE